jgi:tetratricopeptide (TPR) repeat protein
MSYALINQWLNRNRLWSLFVKLAAVLCSVQLIAFLVNLTVPPLHTGRVGEDFERSDSLSHTGSSNLLNGAYLYHDQDPNILFGNFYLTLGIQLAARGQAEASEDMLRKAVHLLPYESDVRMSYAAVLEAVKKDSLALLEYQEVLRQDPENVQALYALGLLQERMGNLDKGLALLHEALRLEPKNFLIHYDLGVLYAKKEDFKNSALYSKNALSYTNNFAEAYNNYGYALAQLGQYKEALDAVEKSLLLKPDSAAALDSKGFALFGMGLYEKALSAYQEALKQDPSIGEVYLHLAQTYEKLNQGRQSVAAYETYLQMTEKTEEKKNTKVRLRLQQLRQQFSNTKSS